MEPKPKIGIGVRFLPDGIGQVLDMYLRDEPNTTVPYAFGRSPVGE